MGTESRAAGTGMAGQAYAYLLDKIQTCAFMPGAELSEKQVMDATGLGRTPVREAVLALQREGLVDVFPRRGTRVALFTEASVNNLYEMRKILEPTVLATYLSQYSKPRLLEFREQFSTDRIPDIAKHYELDIEFHSFLVGVTGNAVLLRTHRDLMTQLFRLAMYAVVLGTSEPAQNSPEHLAVVDAMLREDVQEARDALVFHLNHSLVTSLRSIEAGAGGEGAR